MEWEYPIQKIFLLLQQILNKNNSCLKVVNYGVPYHYSKQETINFVNNLLDHENQPSVAIFLDGLNDFGQPGSVIKGEPHFTPLLTSLVPKGRNLSSKLSSSPQSLSIWKLSVFLRKIFKKTTIYSNSELPSNYTDASAAREISKLLIKNTIRLGKICDAYDVQCFRFLQPVAAVDYIPSANDALTNWVQDENKASRFKIGYDLIRNNTINDIRGISLIDISKLFKNYSGIPYIDGGHYSPRANNLIAESIYSVISPVIINY